MSDRYVSSVAGGASSDADAASERIRNARIWRRLVCASSLLFADITAFAIAIWAFRVGQAVPTVPLHPPMFAHEVRIDLFVILAAVFLVLRYFGGDYTKRQMFWDEVRQVVLSVLILSMASFLVLLMSHKQHSVLSVTVSWLFMFVAVPLLRQSVRYVLRRFGWWNLPTALIGNGPRIETVGKIFRQSPSLGFDVRYLIRHDGDDVTERADESQASTLAGVATIGLSDAANIVRRLCAAGCSEVVIVSEKSSDEKIGNLINRLSAAGVGVAVIPPPQSFPMLGVKINYAFDQGLFLLHVGNNISRVPGRAAKLMMDVIGAALLLVVGMPVLLFIAILIKLDDGGQVFFIQKRIGKGGKEFPCIKFRSMRLDAEDTLERWKQTNSPIYAEYLASNFKLRDDPRVTKIGQRLRRSSADELPQLFNVLFGQMSLVGPRPLLAREISDYGSAIHLYNNVRPGITGLWQVSGRSHTTFAQRASADAWYVQNWSLWYDIVILIKTAKVLANREGAY